MTGVQKKKRFWKAGLVLASGNTFSPLTAAAAVPGQVLVALRSSSLPVSRGSDSYSPAGQCVVLCSTIVVNVKLLGINSADK